MSSQFVNMDLRVRERNPLLGLEYESRWREMPLNQVPSSNKIRLFNIFRILSYVPRLNWISGIAQCAIGIAHMFKNGDEKEKTILMSRCLLRGVATIAFGPYLVVADLAKLYLQEKSLNTRQ